MQCEFCERNFENRVVKENSNYIAINARNPITTGHQIIIPKKHYKKFEEIIDINSFYEFVLDVLSDAKSEYCFTDYIIQSNNGEHASQHVNHFHLHIIPAYENERPFAKKTK